MTVESTLADMEEATEEAKDDLREQWGCDSVDISPNAIVLNWQNDVDEPGENTKAMAEELRTVGEKNGNATVNAFADSDRFTIKIQVN